MDFFFGVDFQPKFFFFLFKKIFFGGGGGGGGLKALSNPTSLCNSKINPWPDSSDEIRLTVRE